MPPTSRMTHHPSKWVGHCHGTCGLSCPLPDQSAEPDLLLAGRPEVYHMRELGIMDIFKGKKINPAWLFQKC